MGGGGRHEQLALGDTPNIAARLQGLAAPNTMVISAATQRLVAGLFECQEIEPQPLKGISIPLSVYRVVQESEAQSRFEVAVSVGLTPLIGREHEVGLLEERWERAKQGLGQVVLLSGEAGIGKSRLLQVLKEQVGTEGRAAGVADAVSVFALLLEQRLVPDDRSVGAGGPDLQPGGVPATEARQTRRVPGAVWPATGGGHAPLCRSVD